MAGREECASLARLGMKKRLWKLVACVGLLIVCLLALTVVALGEDVIEAKLETRPYTLFGPTTVQVNIIVTNISDIQTPITVTLYDPDNNIVTGFGSGGTAYLNAGESKSYTGSWSVTAEQLNKKKVTYAVQYIVTNASGEVSSARKPFSQALVKNDAKVAFNVDRQAPKSVVEGQTVKVTYQCINSGTVDISNIEIKDPDITKETLKLPLLRAGETYTLEASYVAEKTSRTTNAVTTYQYQGATKMESGKLESGVAVISVTIPDLLVKLSASESIVNAGTKVKLTCVITNRSDLSYSQLTVTDPTEGTIESGLSLGPGKATTIERNITVNNSGSYRFKVEGVDSTGALVNFESNDCVVQTVQDEMNQTSVSAVSVPVQLSIVAEADREIIYSKPSPITFHIKVTNFGPIALENVRIETGPAWNRKTVRTIATIDPGQAVDLIKEFSASQDGVYQFFAVAKDTEGKEQTQPSNEFKVSYHELATPPPPSPPPAPDPTPTPEPVAEPTQPFGEGDQTPGPGAGKILLYVLAGLLVVILLAVLMLFILDRRRNNPPSAPKGRDALPTGGGFRDSFERNPHRDYAKAPKRGRNDAGAGHAGRPLAPAYAPDGDEAAKEPAEMRIFDVEPTLPTQGDDSVYRRPGADSASADAPEEDAAPTRETERRVASSMNQTEVFNRDYLSKIRGAAPAETEPETKKKLTDEEAALLSGSTGQYRLQRKFGSVHTAKPERPATQSAPSPLADRKPRTERAQEAPLSSFYSDDDDDDAPAAGRRRRK